MSRTIHVNLIKDEERRSSMPVRTRVMVPIAASLVFLMVLTWYGLLFFKNIGIKENLRDIVAKLEDLKTGNAEVEQLMAREAEAKAEIAQIECYRSGRLLFGETLAHLAGIVSDKTQLTALTIPPPSTAADDKLKARPGVKVRPQTNSTEKVYLNLKGLVDSADTAAVLRKAIQSNDFTNLVKRAEIPPGAFRLNGAVDNSFVFELNCECTGRRFP